MFLFIKSFPKLFKGAFRDLNRHFSITVSSIFSISTALLIALLMALCAVFLNFAASQMESEFVMQVSLTSSLQPAQIAALEQEILALDGIESVEFSDKDTEMARLIEQNEGVFDRYQNENNPLYDVLLVKVSSLSEISALEQQIEALPGVLSIEYGGQLVAQLMQVFDGTKTIGILLVFVMLVLAFFLIRFSVRMNIGTRADEIAIMRQVGAYNWYILTPFVLQGMFIGLVGALLPAAALWLIYPAFYHSMEGSLMSDLLRLPPAEPLVWQLGMLLLVSGLAVGIIGSWSGAGKYLKEVR